MPQCDHSCGGFRSQRTLRQELPPHVEENPRNHSEGKDDVVKHHSSGFPFISATPRKRRPSGEQTDFNGMELHHLYFTSGVVHYISGQLEAHGGDTRISNFTNRMRGRPRMHRSGYPNMKFEMSQSDPIGSSPNKPIDRKYHPLFSWSYLIS